MKKLRITSLIAVFAFFVLAASAQKKYTLRVNPDAGKKISQNLSMTMDIDAAGQKMTTDLNMGFDITNTATKDNSFAFDLKYTGINMKMNMAGMDMAYDSKNPEANDFSKQMHATLGKLLENNITFNVNQLGKSSDIKLPEGINMPFDKSMFENISTVLPEQPVTIGDSWTSKTESDDSGIMVESKMTLIEANELGYKVNVEGKMFGPDANQVGNLQGFYVLDKKTCLTKATEMISDVDMPEAKIKTTLKSQ
ncbi:MULTISPECIES: DUF6263 family protein [unclassified Sphingobacterium]|uniref:DUF6263 family protein n=1 Tax=unclassified Sphingobacterium TaxID=2609468 RepID=UPI001AE1C4E4|nr:MULTISPECIES: DUF6263 family protein [unclassified Sphingobacterium]MDR6734062.1 hypothetical protein [Sphingobacterium sp. 2149]